MRILCLDLSTHTGYAIFDGEVGEKPHLIRYGTIHFGKTVHEFGPYPFSYRRAAQEMASLIVARSWAFGEAHDADVIVIEEVNLGRNRYTQKLLENIHTAILDGLEQWIVDSELRGGHKRVVYLDSSEWRHNLGLRMSKEQRRSNAKLSKAKRTAISSGTKLDKKAIGIKGKTTAKHLAIAFANQQYDLRLKVKDNDAADAICLGLAFCNGATPCDGV